MERQRRKSQSCPRDVETSSGLLGWNSRQGLALKTIALFPCGLFVLVPAPPPAGAFFPSAVGKEVPKFGGANIPRISF